MHFAAFAYVGESVTDPGKYYRNNVAGSLTLLEAMRDHGIDQFVFSSTCATYGIPGPAARSREDTPQRPINPYGASKLMVERMLPTSAPPTACDRSRCAISTRPAPIPMARSARTTIPRRT